MKNKITELVFILDKSGSMAGLEGDTIGGFNALIEKQKRNDEMCNVSTVLFSDKHEVIHDRVPLNRINPMTRDDYTVGGCTALIDAIGRAIHHIETIHNYIRLEDVPDNTVFVITTDGMENASRSYTGAEVRKMIERKKKEFGWEFLFLGANIDAVETAARFGIDREKAANYHADREGTRAVYDSVCEAVSCARMSMPIEASWRSHVDNDFKHRK